MRLQNYINEEKENIESIWIKLIKDCKPFLKELKRSNSISRQFFYRGSNKINADIIKIKPRNNRNPLNTPKKIHNYLDQEFKKKFGWKARSEGVFTTSNFHTGYGKSHIFFPIGKYKYLYSQQILDLYSHLGGGYIEDNYLTNQANIQTIKDAIDTYKSKGMKRAMETTFEVMFKCKEYYMVDMKYNDVLYKKLMENDL